MSQTNNVSQGKNESYRIKVSSPLLRPGLSIETITSQRYLVSTVKHLMDAVREINKSDDN